MENQSAQPTVVQEAEQKKPESTPIASAPTVVHQEPKPVHEAPVIESAQAVAQVEEKKEVTEALPRPEAFMAPQQVTTISSEEKVSNPVESKMQERPNTQNSNIIDKVDNSVSQENSINNSGLNVALDSQENTSFSVQNKIQEDSSVYLKLFVGGLYYQTEEDVNNYFAKYGEIVDCQLLRHRQTGRSRGFAFVTIKDPSGSVKKVLLGKRNEINGKFVDIKLAEDNKTREKIEQSSCKVFVGGIEGSVTTEELRDYRKRILRYILI